MKMDFVIVVVTVKTIAVDIGLVFGAIVVVVVVFCHSYFIHFQFIKKQRSRAHAKGINSIKW